MSLQTVATSRRNDYAPLRAWNIARAVGMPRQFMESCKVHMSFEDMRVWFSWRGSNGERYKHELGDMLDDELQILRVKVRLSTC